MRTTLDIGEDVLAAARAVAEREHKSLGEVVTQMARRALAPKRATRVRNGVPLLPLRKNTAVDLDLVNRLRDES